ncbi:MAG: sigma-70 family RNA polymerase sigma factor [Bryobacteraceae bacterium]|nr:sigma-70 family RNA polymerase sigma factor [Bryobacteraceae bacterium]
MIVATVVRTASASGIPDRADIEDLVQEVYLKLCAQNYRVLRSVRSDHPNSVYGLVRAVSHSTTIDYLRRLRNPTLDARKTVSLAALEQDLALSRPAENELHRRLLFERLDVMLSDLCPPETAVRDRNTFWLYYRQGFTSKEIAALPALDLTVKGVESLLFRLTAALRNRLSDEDGKGLGPSARP